MTNQKPAAKTIATMTADGYAPAVAKNAGGVFPIHNTWQKENVRVSWEDNGSWTIYVFDGKTSSYDVTFDAGAPDAVVLATVAAILGA